MPVVITTAPETEPVTLGAVKRHLRVSHDDDNTMLGGLIAAAREYVEDRTHRAMVTQQATLYLDGFLYRMEIPLPPLVSVQSVKYLDTDGNQQTLDASVYRVDINSTPGRITLGYAQTWPSLYGVERQVEIAFTSGYGEAKDVPDRLKSAVKLYVQKLYDRDEREQELLDDTISSLIRPYVIDQF